MTHLVSHRLIITKKKESPTNIFTITQFNLTAAVSCHMCTPYDAKSTQVMTFNCTQALNFLFTTETGQARHSYEIIEFSFRNKDHFFHSPFGEKTIIYFQHLIWPKTQNEVHSNYQFNTQQINCFYATNIYKYW